jgi:hypothetical protein
MSKTRINSLLVLLLLGLVCAVLASAQQPETQSSQNTCTSCHALSAVLPKEHVEPEGNTLDACVACHSTGLSGDAKPNAFSTRLHRAHVGGAKANLDCTACHTFVPGKSFGLIGTDVSSGAPKDDDMKAMKEIFASWAKSSYTDHLHGKAMVDCAGCHGKEAPLLDTTVENSRCLTCHGPLEQLARKTAPKDFPKRNPHDSHLGDIACTVCHHAHAVSKAYCLDCHKTFKMKIPGGEE